jgi:ornithine cyclodeaminase/alanine dehydrogenase-like protein (mu-crystallin family)
MPLLLLESDVEQLLDMPTAIKVVEQAFVELGCGRATNHPRSRIHVKHGGLQLMGAALPASGVVGFKAYTWFTSGSRFLVNLYSSSTGELLAIIEADRLGQIRTGAVTGVATRWMAREDAGTVGLIGTGYQARSQLQAVCAVRKIKRVLAFSRRAERRAAFCQSMEAELKVEVVPVSSPQDAVEPSDIVITATTGMEPTFDGDWLREGTQVNAIGGNSLVRAEVDTATIVRSSRIVVDSLEQAKIEAGDFLRPVDRGLLYWERVFELGAVVTGRVPGRESAREITLFKSLGIGLEDLAVGAIVYQRALEQKRGQPILN